jgi:hypothetical protein
MYSARFDTGQACRHARPDRRTHAEREDQDHGADAAGRRSVPRVARRRSDRVLRRSAVLRPHAATSPSAIAGGVCRLRFRVPRTAHVAATTLLPIPPASAVLPPIGRGLHARPATPTIRRRTVPIRRHQPATNDTRHVGSARHGSLLSRGLFCGETRGGPRQCHGGRRGYPLGGTCPGCLCAVLRAGANGSGSVAVCVAARAPGGPRGVHVAPSMSAYPRAHRTAIRWRPSWGSPQ